MIDKHGEAFEILGRAYEKLQAENARLAAEVERLKKSNKLLADEARKRAYSRVDHVETEHLRTELAAAQADCWAMVCWLKELACHDPLCRYAERMRDNECTCGLSAILARTHPGEPLLRRLEAADEGKKLCPCNCHDPEARKATGMEEHPSCGHCAREVVDESLALEEREHELRKADEDKMVKRLVMAERRFEAAEELRASIEECGEHTERAFVVLPSRIGREQQARLTRALADYDAAKAGKENPDA